MATTTPRTKFTIRELIMIGVFSQLLRRMPSTRTVAFYRVTGKEGDPVIYGCACCDKYDTAGNMRNFGRYVVCPEHGMQIGKALDQADCHRGIPVGGFTLATTLDKVGTIEAGDDGEHLKIADDKILGEPDYLERIFAKARDQERRDRQRQAHRDDRRGSDRSQGRPRDTRSDGPMAGALRDVRAPDRRFASPAPRPATVAAAIAIAAPAAVVASAAAASPEPVQPTPTPEPIPAPAPSIALPVVDPIDTMDLATIKRKRTDLHRVKDVLGDAEYARQMRKLLARQRQIEDTELAELEGESTDPAGKGNEPVALAPVPAPIPSVVPAPTPATVAPAAASVPAPASGRNGLKLVTPAPEAAPAPVEEEETVDLVALTLEVLRRACKLDTARQIRRGQVLTSGGQVTSVTCLVAANSKACKVSGAPGTMSAFRGHPNLGAGQHFAICRICKAFAAGDSDLASRILRDQDYASVLAEEERERRGPARSHGHGPSTGHSNGKAKAKPARTDAELTDVERELQERLRREQVYTCAKTGSGCMQPKGTKLRVIYDPETRRPTTDRVHGVCGKCLARTPKKRAPKAVVVETAPKAPKLSKEQREAAKRAARQGQHG